MAGIGKHRVAAWCSTGSWRNCYRVMWSQGQLIQKRLERLT